MSTEFRVREARLRFEAAERAALDAKVQPILNQIARTQKQIEAEQDALMKQYWSRHIDKVTDAETCHDPDALDEGVTLPKLANKELRTAEHADKEYAAFHEFLERNRRRGYTLDQNGERRLVTYCVTQFNQGLADMSDDKTWDRAFQRLQTLDAFKEGELTFGEASEEPEPETPAEPIAETPKATQIDIEKIDSTTREGAQILRRVAQGAFLENVVAPLFDEWRKSLVDNFGLYLTREQQVAVIDSFQHHNLNWSRAADYDRVRRALVMSHVFPETALTADEKLAIDIENSDMRGRESRVAFAERARKLTIGK